MRRLELFVAFASLLCLSGCAVDGGGTCQEGVVVDRVTVTGGTVTWTYDGLTETVAIGEGEALRCAVEVATGIVAPGIGEELRPRYSLECVADGEPFIRTDDQGRAIARRGFQVSWTDDGDVRDWEVDTEQFVPSDQTVHYADACHETGDCFEWCEASLSPAPLEVERTVTVAVGDRADYPAVVSDDFRREWMVKVSVPTSAGTRRNPAGACERTVMAELELSFALDREDVRLESEAVCSE